MPDLWLKSTKLALLIGQDGQMLVAVNCCFQLCHGCSCLLNEVSVLGFMKHVFLIF